MPTPSEILEQALQRASANLNKPLIGQPAVVSRIEVVSRNPQNRAAVRLVLACALAKTHRPEVDIRKPYTEIGTPDAFSGRTYDERYLTPFIFAHQLPCNSTTAFLTPALRNHNAALTFDLNLVGRPATLYQAALQLLTDVYEGISTADDLLAETLRWLLLVREEQKQRMSSLLASLHATGTTLLAAEGIITMVEQHLRSPGSSRLPVLLVAAAYEAAGTQLGERSLPLASHNAADRQTGAIGDLEVMLTRTDEVVTGYEMKMRRVTPSDINAALFKLAGRSIQNYIFITTEVITQEVRDYAATIYLRTGTEVVVLDCLSFLRHFLHLFYRHRSTFVEAYQRLVLAEPDSAVGQPLKELWLTLRQAAESGLLDEEQGLEMALDKRGQDSEAVVASLSCPS